ncbi:MAG TPA: DinB family protein [Dehalococcoidia bacterium]|nr:DinB family protein [Dehalococcoidia bacterium]
MTTTAAALPLSTFYGGWEMYQRNLAEIIAPLSPEQLVLPASSRHYSIGMVTQHVIANRVWWFHVWMGEGSPDLAPIAHWDPADPVEVPPRSSAELVTGFKATWQLVADVLARWTPADLSQRFAPPPQMREEERRAIGERTRQWIIWHVLEHEIHHGGELSLALGGYGLERIYGTL